MSIYHVYIGTPELLSIPVLKFEKFSICLCVQKLQDQGQDSGLIKHCIEQHNKFSSVLAVSALFALACLKVLVITIII